jgi:ATP-binding cassette, subfamily C, bacteriocin exporter
MLRRLPPTKQHDASDCGAACLRSVAAFYGKRAPLARIRDYASTDGSGTTVSGLVEASRSLGLRATAVRAAQEALRRLPVPCIAHLVQANGWQHYVVLSGFGRDKIRLMDPAEGRRLSVPEDEFRRQWSGVAVLLAPDSGFERGAETERPALRFWRLVRPHRTVMARALAGAVLYTVLGLSTAIYVQKIVDHVLVDGNANLLNLLTVLMLCVLLVQGYVGWMKNLIGLRTAQQIDAALIAGYYHHLLHLPQRFFDTMKVGEIVSRVGDAIKIRAFVNDVSLELLVNVLVVAWSSALMFAYDWRLALGVLCALPVYAAIFAAANRINRSVLRQTMERTAELESQLVESIGAVGTVRRFGLQAFFGRETERRLVRLLRPVYAAGKTAVFANGASELVSRVAVVGVLWAGSRLVLAAELTPGQLMSFYALVGYLTGPASQLVTANRAVQDALIAADRLFEIMDLEVDAFRTAPAVNLRRGSPLDVRFDEVSFRYGSRSNIFDRLDLHIEAGRVTAVVGESGSGKSTLLALAQAIYPVTRGRIRIGGYDLRVLDTRTLKERFAVVQQEVQLFAGSIIENVAIGDTGPDMARILDVCDRLGITDFAERLPQGFHSRIGENGAGLSGGQRQRIAIARALYREPDILAFDEATSNLDSISEQYVRSVVRDLRNAGRTIIVIAHRLASIVAADTILMLEHGRLAERGTHRELLARGGAYARLWRAQHGWVEGEEERNVRPVTVGASP